MTAWLGVVSAAHVRRARSLGFAQVNEGTRAGLARMSAGDRLFYYSPVEERGDAERLQEFTAVGIVADDTIWREDEGAFRPFRRRVDYLVTHPVALDDVRDQLELTSAANWGYQLRRGLIPLSDADAELIESKMVA